MSDIEIDTAPVDTRFANVNQAKHCYMYYNSFWDCAAADGAEDRTCVQLKKYYRAMCPDEWVSKWDEQREAGNFAGPDPGSVFKPE